MTTMQEMKENWVVLVIAFSLVFFSFGVPNFSLPWIYRPAMDEFGWSNAQVNLLSTAKFLVGALAALGMGIMIDRVGGKVSVLLGALSGGFAMLMFLVATNLPIYYLAGGMLGLSASSIVAAMKVIVSRLFDINQGIAIGIVLGGTSAGQLVMPLIWSPLLDAGINWREIFAMLSLGSFLISTPLWIIFMAKTGKTQDIINASSAAHKDGLTMWGHFKEVCQEKGFWLLAIAIFLVSAVDQALMQNYVTFLRSDRGLNHRDFAWLVSLVSVLAIASKVGSGWFYDRFSIPGIRFFYFMLGASVILALPVTGIGTMAIFLIVRNVAHGGMIVEAPVITKHYLGPRNLGMTIGVVSVFVNLGFAAGPPLLGYLYDLNGNYTFGFVLYSAVAILAGICLLPLKPRYWTPPRKRKQENPGTASMQPAAT